MTLADPTRNHIIIGMTVATDSTITYQYADGSTSYHRPERDGVSLSAALSNGTAT